MQPSYISIDELEHDPDMKHCTAHKATFHPSAATARWVASCHQNHPFFPWQHFDVLAFVQGGNMENLDDLDLLQTVADLQTPLIASVGHVEEKLFIKQIADKEAPTPNGLGQYFSDIVEQVSEKKTRSRAALTEQIKKQFKDQLEAGQKQNKELQEKLTQIQKAYTL